MIDLTPDQFRALGYRAIDLIAEQLAALPSAPCRRAMPDALRQSLLNQPLPAAGRDPDQVLDATTARASLAGSTRPPPRWACWPSCWPAA
jgi:hypothetical protein